MIGLIASGPVAEVPPASGVAKPTMKEEAFSLTTPFQHPAAIPGWKRFLDLVCILLVSPGLLLIMTIIAVAIKLVSRGPVLFKQERVGFLGRRFKCFKFRTMRVDAPV